jgi:hypothetical protein
MTVRRFSKFVLQVIQNNKLLRENVPELNLDNFGQKVIYEQNWPLQRRTWMAISSVVYSQSKTVVATKRIALFLSGLLQFRQGKIVRISIIDLIPIPYENIHFYNEYVARRQFSY